jgi:hypothetical protein
MGRLGVGHRSSPQLANLSLELLDPSREALDVDAQCLVFHGRYRPR